MAPHTTRPPVAYFAQVVPGLEEIAREELAELAPGITFDRTLRRFDERTSIVPFQLTGSPQVLCQARTVEDLFVTLVDRTGIPDGREGLRTIHAAVATVAGERAVSTALELRPRRKGPVTVRVIARTAGRRAYRRIDLQRAVERALRERFPRWKPVEDDAVLEVWVQTIQARLLVGLRLSTNELRRRSWRAVSLPAALKPTIAAAMVRLSDPDPNDLVLDPMCGSGTIPIERALAARYRLILCGDIDPAAVAATRANIGRRYRPIEVRQWDARRLPLAAGSVDALLCNLPFGKQIGSPGELRRLFPELIAEWDRVLAARGRMVLLTGDRRLLCEAVARRPNLRLRGQTDVLVRGRPATITVIGRAG